MWNLERSVCLGDDGVCHRVGTLMSIRGSRGALPCLPFASLQPLGNLRKDHSHIPISCLCTWRCGHVRDVQTYVHGRRVGGGFVAYGQQVRLPLS